MQLSGRLQGCKSFRSSAKKITGVLPSRGSLVISCSSQKRPQPEGKGRKDSRFVRLPNDSGQPNSTTAPMLVLPSPTSLDSDSESQALSGTLPAQAFFEFPEDADKTNLGRITFYCVAESFDRKHLDDYLRDTHSSSKVITYPGVTYVEFSKAAADEAGGDVFFFDYGVIACWGLTKVQEVLLVNGIPPLCHIQRLPAPEVEVESLQYNFTASEQSHVQNDTVTLNKRFAQNHKMKLAISYALAQATKLSVYEKRVTTIVEETESLPQALAEHGEVKLSGKDIAKLIGKVFLQKRSVNLLSAVLDTPEFFWHAPDSYQALYERVAEYVELRTRVELLNQRFDVLGEMLDLLRAYQSNDHGTRLEMIVIYLIAVEVVIGALELIQLFGPGGHK